MSEFPEAPTLPEGLSLFVHGKEGVIYLSKAPAFAAALLVQLWAKRITLVLGLDGPHNSERMGLTNLSDYRNRFNAIR